MSESVQILRSWLGVARSLLVGIAGFDETDSVINGIDGALAAPIEVVPGLADRKHFDRVVAENAQLRDEIRLDDELLTKLRDEIRVDDELLKSRDRLLDLLPCPMHGPCVPYTIDRIRQLLDIESRVWTLLNGVALRPKPPAHDPLP